MRTQDTSSQSALLDGGAKGGAIPPCGFPAGVVHSSVPVDGIGAAATATPYSGKEEMKRTGTEHKSTPGSTFQDYLDIGFRSSATTEHKRDTAPLATGFVPPSILREPGKGHTSFQSILPLAGGKGKPGEMGVPPSTHTKEDGIRSTHESGRRNRRGRGGRENDEGGDSMQGQAVDPPRTEGTMERVSSHMLLGSSSVHGSSTCTPNILSRRSSGIHSPNELVNSNFSVCTVNSSTMTVNSGNDHAPVPHDAHGRHRKRSSPSPPHSLNPHPHFPNTLPCIRSFNSTPPASAAASQNSEEGISSLLRHAKPSMAPPLHGSSTFNAGGVIVGVTGSPLSKSEASASEFTHPRCRTSSAADAMNSTSSLGQKKDLSLLWNQPQRSHHSASVSSSSAGYNASRGDSFHPSMTGGRGGGEHGGSRNNKSSPTSSAMELGGLRGPPHASEEKSNTNIFLRRLSPGAVESELTAAFAPFGAIASSVIMRDIHTGASYGKAFVRFENPDDARRAMSALQGRLIHGEPIALQWANKEHDTTPVGEERKKIKKVFIRNIPLKVTREDIYELCQQFGPMSSVTLSPDSVKAIGLSYEGAHGKSGVSKSVESHEEGSASRGGSTIAIGAGARQVGEEGTANKAPPSPIGEERKGLGGDGSAEGSAVGWLPSSIHGEDGGGGGRPPGILNIAFVQYVNDGDAEKAVHALHYTRPFPHLDEGIPLMVKLTEPKKQRLERKKQGGGNSGTNKESKDWASFHYSQGQPSQEPRTHTDPTASRSYSPRSWERETSHVGSACGGGDGPTLVRVFSSNYGDHASSVSHSTSSLHPSSPLFAAAGNGLPSGFPFPVEGSGGKTQSYAGSGAIVRPAPLPGAQNNPNPNDSIPLHGFASPSSSSSWATGLHFFVADPRTQNPFSITGDDEERGGDGDGGSPWLLSSQEADGDGKKEKDGMLFSSPAVSSFYKDFRQGEEDGPGDTLHPLFAQLPSLTSPSASGTERREDGDDKKVDDSPHADASPLDGTIASTLPQGNAVMGSNGGFLHSFQPMTSVFSSSTPVNQSPFSGSPLVPASSTSNVTGNMATGKGMVTFSSGFLPGDYVIPGTGANQATWMVGTGLDRRILPRPTSGGGTSREDAGATAQHVNPSSVPTTMMVGMLPSAYYPSHATPYVLQLGGSGVVLADNGWRVGSQGREGRGGEWSPAGGMGVTATANSLPAFTLNSSQENHGVLFTTGGGGGGAGEYMWMPSAMPSATPFPLYFTAPATDVATPSFPLHGVAMPSAEVYALPSSQMSTGREGVGGPRGREGREPVSGTHPLAPAMERGMPFSSSSSTHSSSSSSPSHGSKKGGLQDTMTYRSIEPQTALLAAATSHTFPPAPEECTEKDGRAANAEEGGDPHKNGGEGGVGSTASRQAPLVSTLSPDGASFIPSSSPSVAASFSSAGKGVGSRSPSPSNGITRPASYYDGGGGGGTGSRPMVASLGAPEYVPPGAATAYSLSSSSPSASPPPFLPFSGVSSPLPPLLPLVSSVGLTSLTSAPPGVGFPMAQGYPQDAPLPPNPTAGGGMETREIEAGGGMMEKMLPQQPYPGEVLFRYPEDSPYAVTQPFHESPVPIYPGGTVVPSLPTSSSGSLAGKANTHRTRSGEEDKDHHEKSRPTEEDGSAYRDGEYLNGGGVGKERGFFSPEFAFPVGSSEGSPTRESIVRWEFTEEEDT